MKKIIVLMLLTLLCFNAKAQIEQIIRKANAGDVYSQYLAGWSYANGSNGAIRNYNTASKWLNKAIKNRSSIAAQFYGTLYYYGIGMPQNKEKALTYYKKAKEFGATDEVLINTMIDNCAYSSSYQPPKKNAQKSVEIASSNNLPILEVVPKSFKFIDPSGNNAIDAGEKCYIEFNVLNKGKGTAKNCKASIQSSDAHPNLTFESLDLPIINAGQTAVVKIPIEADMNLKNGDVDLVALVNEPHGLGTDSILFSVATKQFVAPKLEIVDYAITSTNGTSLKKKTPFDLQVLLQNIQKGNAEDVTVEFKAPNGIIAMNSDKVKEIFPLITGGETKSIVYQIIITDNFKGNTIPIDVLISEKYGKYAQNKHINLTLNQAMAANKIVVEEKGSNEKSFAIQVASLTSDVDKNIPVVDNKADNVFAVVIGNESYNKESGVPFAANDGKIFAKYCKDVLGLPEENIHLAVNATLNDMKHEIGWLSKVLETRKGKAKAIFYYAGHGIPDEASKNAYLLPVDGYGNDVSTGYPLEKLYADLGNVPSQSVTVFLDACFSGAKREGGMLASSRGIALKANRGIPVGNVVVFSAAQGDETAYPYKKEGHGLFTYYLLKELKDTKGDVTLKQLENFVTEKVSQQSIVINSKPQTPTIIPAKTISGNWENWKLR